MARRKVYHVVPKQKRGWNVKKENASRASSSHETKNKAIAQAKKLAKNQELDQVIIHKKDGTIQTEYTYGEDPYPPTG
jgi:uncharacterized protein YdaT